MARSPLTLAALATAAVSGLDVIAATGFGDGDDFESALITARDGKRWVIRVPTSERSEAEQSADLVSLRALSVGVRSRLPFGVPTFAGQAPVSGTRAVVYDVVDGDAVTLARLDHELATSVGRATAAIHMLPTSFVADAGLPVLTPIEILRGLITVMDRASATNLVPAALLGRWERATEDSALWQFQPTVVNGSLSADSFLAHDGTVTGVIGWHNLSVGDPARDLYWLLGARTADVASAGFDTYTQTRGASDRQVRQRATLYSELEIAKWLLHGTQERSTEIVDDAVSMLQGLADGVDGDLDRTISHNTMPVMAVDEVEAMLDERDRNQQ